MALITKAIFGGALLSLACWCAALMPSKPMFSLVFCIGLILIVLMDAKLFTSAVLTNDAVECSVIYLMNMIGCIAVFVILGYSGYSLENIESIGATKSLLGNTQLFLRGILCNLCVCMATYLASKEDTAVGKVIVIVPPIFLFVMSGFEHSIAGMFFKVTLEALTMITLGNIVGGLIIRWYTKEETKNG